MATPATAAPAQAVLGGGSGILLADAAGDVAACTLTTIGHDGAGRLVGITAGHCGDPGDAVIPEFGWDGTPVGTIVDDYPALDVAVVQFDPARVAPVNQVGGMTITGTGSPVDFPGVACKDGRTTGVTCGVTWLTDTVRHETWTQICVMEGDSGAPVVVGTTLVGMINAFIQVPCLSPTVGTTMDAALGAINAAGGVGAGFRPI
ncbi:serine protease [Tomitella fengzijianii]|uniref:Serine protease n=1 Tax=Tomitella fengzijianii TaxID=2597660 RepID=A0A516X868_9ACTN|nr:serine protease [Tomitella fengzijianii]